MNILLSFLNLQKQNVSFCLQPPNFWGMDGTEITGLITPSELQCRQTKARKMLPVQAGKPFPAKGWERFWPQEPPQAAAYHMEFKVLKSGGKKEKPSRKHQKQLEIMQKGLYAFSHPHGRPSPARFSLPIFRPVFRTIPSKLNISTIHFSQLFWLKTGWFGRLAQLWERRVRIAAVDG